MKLEKRSSEETVQPQEPDKQPTGKKPVVIYIMILFIAAFLLMALSFLMHQRSNSEALGQLQNSVSAMQEVQATQERIIALQEELVRAEKELDDQKASYEQELQAAQDETAACREAAEALTGLYCLQQEYSAKDYESCREIIRQMEEKKYPALLPGTVSAGSGITPPSERYQELKEAVEAKLAEQGR